MTAKARWLLRVELHVVFKARADGERRFNPSRLCVLLDEDIGVYKVILTGGNSDDGNNSNASLGSQVVHCNCSSCGFLRISENYVVLNVGRPYPPA